MFDMCARAAAAAAARGRISFRVLVYMYRKTYISLCFSLFRQFGLGTFSGDRQKYESVVSRNVIWSTASAFSHTISIDLIQSSRATFRLFLLGRHHVVKLWKVDLQMKLVFLVLARFGYTVRHDSLGHRRPRQPRQSFPTSRRHWSWHPAWTWRASTLLHWWTLCSYKHVNIERLGRWLIPDVTIAILVEYLYKSDVLT